MATLRLGTRGSALALAQATLTEAALKASEPTLAVERVVIKTTGDKVSESGGDPGDKGVFVKELEEALRDRRIDAAVHSLKDLPVDLPAGLVLTATLPREDPRDAFCSADGRILDELPDGATIGTGSPRRVAQLMRLYSRLSFVPIRGNVDTRLRKMREGQVAGIILARAGLARLGLLGQVTQLIEPEVVLPAPGQGAIGLECRADDAATKTILAKLNHAPTMHAVLAERSFLRHLGGGCRTPIAAYGRLKGESLTLHGFVGDPKGGLFVAGAAEAPASDAEPLGIRLAESLLTQGAADLLK